MSQFLGTEMSPRGIVYNYGSEARFCTIPSSMLISLFYAYGCIVDPCDRSGMCLSPEVVAKLDTLAHQANDIPLCRILHSIAHPAESKLAAATRSAQECFSRASRVEQREIVSTWTTLLEIGLYLAGWKTNEAGVQFKIASGANPDMVPTQVEPYPTKMVPVRDIVRMEFQIWPLLSAIAEPACDVDSFPIIAYVLSPSGTASPRLEGTHTVGSIRELIGESDSGEIAEAIISTAYYYLTVITGTPMPMLNPLIGSFVAGA